MLGYIEIFGMLNVGKMVVMMIKVFVVQQFGMLEFFLFERKLKKLIIVFFDKDWVVEFGICLMGGVYFWVKEGELIGWNFVVLLLIK